MVVPAALRVRHSTTSRWAYGTMQIKLQASEMRDAFHHDDGMAFAYPANYSI